MATFSNTKNPLFVCKLCMTESRNKKDFAKHLLTRKHIKQGEPQQIDNNNIQISQQHECSNCKKVYESRSGLWRHKKTCVETETAQLLDPSSSEIKVLTTLILEMVKSNTELQKQNTELQKQSSELQKQVLDVCKNSNTINTINSNNNSNNKTFNLQFFLNEECKDAMNISDFVNTFDLQLDDLESVGKLGYVEGITKQIIDKLNSMDIYKRPMHCSDAKRETIYIKDDNKWEKEERGTPKLRKVIKNLSFNNMKLIAKWSDTYPDSKSSESRLNDKYMKLVKQTTGGNGELSENEDKIIRRIAKEIIIEK